MKRQRWNLFVLLAFCVLVWAVDVSGEEAATEPVTYNATINGMAHTIPGLQFQFKAKGTMKWDKATGKVSLSAKTSSGAYTGSGYLAKGKTASYGSTSFNSGQTKGNAIIVGKFTSGVAKFSGSFTSAMPNGFGPPPDGFIYVTGTITAVRTD